MTDLFPELFLTTAPGPAPGLAQVAFADGPLGRSASAVAGQVGTWTVVFTAGPGGIAPGGGVALWWPHQGFRFSKRSQSIWANKRGYVSAETAARCQLELLVNSRDPGHTHPLAAVLVRGQPLAEGQQILLCFNDSSGGSPPEMVIPNVVPAMALHAGIDTDGSGTFYELAGSPLTVGITAGQVPARYLVLVPTTPAPGEPHDVQIAALDRCGNLAPAVNAEFQIQAGECTGLPERLSLSPLEGGRCRVEGVRFGPGVQQIQVTDLQRGIEAVSNPVCCSPEPQYRVYWGELHTHCYDSALWLDLNATTDPDYQYRYGRDVSRLDFCCLNFHLYLENGFAGQEAAWTLLQKAAARHQAPGHYFTFAGFETHGFGGDRCIILNGDRFPDLRLRDLYGSNTRRHLESAADLQRMFDWATGQGAMVTCHVGGTPANLDFHDPRVQWSVELASMHGNFEWFGQEALRRGLRVGFHGASDGHVQTPGHPRRPGSGGRNGDLNRRDTGYGSGCLVGVLATELSREAIWDAFRARRTYATTGARLWLEFQVEGQPMGSEVALEGPPTLTARVVGSAGIERLELIRDDRLLHTQPGEGKEAVLTFRDDDCPRGEHYYYLRVSQRDGEIAWSSPVWVNRSGGAETAAHSLPLWNDDDAEVPVALAPGEAKRYEAQLLDYLRREEDASRWEGIQAIDLIDSPMGRYVLLLGHDHKHQKRVHFKLFVDYADVVLRMDLGGRDFGQFPNPGAAAFEDYQDGPRSIR